MDVGTVVWVGIGLLIGVVLWKTGIGMLRSLTRPLPPPPPAGEMRRVNVRYRCGVCGVELRLKLSGLKEIERWVMGWAGHAEVLAPPELVESIRAGAERIIDSTRPRSKF